jgi:hypothetical protein
MSDIFISYAREDRFRVEPLAQALMAKGWSVWWDRDITFGKPFDQVIDEELSKARCVIVIWSTTSIKSRWVLSEAHDGLERRILIPVLIDRVVLPVWCRLVQTADLIEWNGKTAFPEFQKLVNDIASILNLAHDPSHKSENEGNTVINKTVQRRHYFEFIRQKFKPTRLALIVLLVGSGIGIGSFVLPLLRSEVLPALPKEQTNPVIPNQSSPPPQSGDLSHANQPSPAQDGKLLSNLPQNEGVRVVKTRVKGVIAELTKFAKSGGFITAGLSVKNNTSKMVKFCVPDQSWREEYRIIGENTKTQWNPTYVSGGGSCSFRGGLLYMQLEQSSSHIVWLKFDIKEEVEEKYTLDASFLEEPIEGLSAE